MFNRIQFLNKGLFNRFSVVSLRRLSSMEQKIRIGVCQLNSKEDKQMNLNIGKELIEKGKELNAKIIFFPEAFDYICPSKSLTIEYAEKLDGTIIEHYRHLAKEHQIWLSLGGFHRKTDHSSKVFNTHLLINDQGNIVGQYDKIHLFDVQSGSTSYKESDFTHPGEQFPSPISTPFGRIALSICYDLRFPELSRFLTLSNESGAQILTYPSAFTKVTGQAHWEVLLRARAIENQCYVVAAAQTGIHSNNRESYGHSLVIDPWGKVLLDMGTNGPSIETVDIDLQLIDEVKRKMPIEEHRRTDLYRLHPSNSLQRVEINDEKDENIRWGQLEISSRQVFYRTRFSFATVNKKPVVTGHVLVSPLRRVERFAQLNSEEIEDLFLSTQLISKQIEEIYRGQSLTIAIQDGPFAGQTVRHVHVHILPRKEGDFQENDSIYDRLSHHDKQERGWRTEEEMYEEAKALRQYFYKNVE